MLVEVALVISSIVYGTMARLGVWITDDRHVQSTNKSNESENVGILLYKVEYTLSMALIWTKNVLAE